MGMEDKLLSLLKGSRPPKYKGIGLRGGFALAIYWASVGGVAGGLGWNLAGLIVAALGGTMVGYRLEGLGGAIAVAIFSAFHWTAVATSAMAGTPLGVLLGIVIGTVGGMVIGAKTRE
jgi:hypothetical protein